MAAFGLISINVHRKSDGENISLKTTKKTESITVQSDQRGKHEHHEQVAERQRKLELVSEYIRNLPMRTSHYSREAYPDRNLPVRTSHYSRKAFLDRNLPVRTSHYCRKAYPGRRYYKCTQQDYDKHCCECTKSDYGKHCECTKSD